jgi:ABC-type transport system substrate-binding protein
MRQAEEATIAVSWAKLAVKVNPNYVSQSSLLGGWSQGGVADRGKFQVAMFAYLGSPDPDQYKFNLESRYCDRRARTHSIVNGNYSCVRDGLIDRSFTAAARTLNAPARARIYAAVGREVNAQAYWVPLYFRPVIATDDGRVANFSTNPTVLGPTWNVYAWKVKGR